MENRIFLVDEWETISINGGIPHYGYYHRYRLPNGEINKDFYADRISGLILDVKEKKERGLNYFYQQLENLISKNVTICVVPSHEASDKNQSGIAELARRLAKDGRIDKVDFLLRNNTIAKLATGGERSVDVQLESLKTNPDLSIEGDVILLVDDVTTSGNSLRACKEILLRNGAKRVAMFALGQSI